jgi:uncharacterized membrane protein YfcA
MIKLPRERRVRLAAAVLLATASRGACAAVTGALADSVADWMSVFILLVMPPAAIYLFWILHILPEKAAKKRNHPQKDAIHMLCLLSLVFGGLLWPIAMLWAYVKPMGMRVALVEAEHLHATELPKVQAPLEPEPLQEVNITTPPRDGKSG